MYIFYLNVRHDIPLIVHTVTTTAASASIVEMSKPHFNGGLTTLNSQMNNRVILLFNSSYIAPYKVHHQIEI